MARTTEKGAHAPTPPREERYEEALEGIREALGKVDFPNFEGLWADLPRLDVPELDAGELVRRLTLVNVEALLREPRAIAWALEHVADDRLMESLLVALPRSSGDEQWDQLLGPFTTWKGAVARLDDLDTRQGLDRRRDHHQVLGCQTGDRTWLYPLFQFARGDVLPGLPDVLAELVPVTDGWTTGLWLRTPNTRLDGYTPAAWLEECQRRATILAAARDQGAQWSGRSEDRAGAA